MRIGLKEDLYLQPHAAGPLRPLRNMIRLALGKPPVQHSVLHRTPWEQWRLWQNMTPQSTAQKICHAAENNDYTALAHTLGNGRFADPNHPRSDGSLPVFLALERDRSQALQILLGQPNLDLTVQDAHGLTPIAKAIQLGHAANVRTLLNAQRDGHYLIDPKAKVGNNPSVLESALALGDAGVMKALLEHPNCPTTPEERDDLAELAQSINQPDAVEALDQYSTTLTKTLQALVMEDEPRDWAALARVLPRAAPKDLPPHNLLAELCDDTGTSKQDRRAVAEYLGKGYLAELDTCFWMMVGTLPHNTSRHIGQMLAAMTLARAAPDSPSIEDADNFVHQLLQSVMANDENSTGREQAVAEEALRCLLDLSPIVRGQVSVLDPADAHHHPAAAAMVAILFEAASLAQGGGDAGPSNANEGR